MTERGSRKETVARLRFAGTTARSGGGRRQSLQEAIVDGGSGSDPARLGLCLGACPQRGLALKRSGPVFRPGRMQFLVRLDDPLFACGFSHRFLELLEGANLDLADTLAADIVFSREVFQRGRLLLEAAFGDDVALAFVE